MSTQAARPIPRSVHVFIVVLAALVAAVVLVPVPDAHERSWTPLPLLLSLLVAAEWLVLRFRYRDEINGLNLFEAALCPLIVSYPTWTVVATVMVAQTITGFFRHNDRVRGSFNVAQWALAAGAGSLVFTALHIGHEASLFNVVSLLTAMVVVFIVNQMAFTAVVALAEGLRPREVVAGLAPVIVSGWAAGWIINTSFGLVFTAAFLLNHWSVLLFFVPLRVLHFAHRNYASAVAERARLADVHHASRTLSRPVDPREAIPEFLAEVARSWNAEIVELLLAEREGWVLHRWQAGAVPYVTRSTPPEGALVLRLADEGTPLSIATMSAAGAMRDAMRAEDRRSLLCSPVRHGEDALGVLCISNWAGLDGAHEGERAILESLTREVAAVLKKGEALQENLEERTTLSRIIANASDGICTLAADGTVRTWNPGLEQITGWLSADVIGRRGIEFLDPQGGSGDPVAYAAWAKAESLPVKLRITDRRGEHHWLECSYGSIPALSEQVQGQLVIIARDVSGIREMEQLKEDYGRLAEREAAQRAVVHRLQEAVRPPTPTVPGAELGVYYLASDPSARTGGDLYDWQVLPDGDVHIAVVDVLGHGVQATKDAMTVTHVLRVLALEDIPLERLLARAQELLAAHDTELVATALVGRYTPASGRIRLVGAGHPPALVVEPDGEVHEVFAPGVALGWPGAGSTEVIEGTIEAGDTLVLYTDGLIEATRDVLEGLRTLKGAASEMAGYPATKLARALVDRTLAAGSRRDDSLALVLRRRSVGEAVDAIAGGGETLELAISGNEGLAGLRHDVSAWLISRGMRLDDVDDTILVVTELGTNGVKAGARIITVRLSLEGSSLAVEVEDDGRGFDRSTVVSGADPMSERGRGLFIVQALSDDLGVFTDRDGTIV
ncbi:MAG TPA: SpoIIE family protein phosphatase, partial [Acidimicrobiales bacterium]|nr:SpoIIE family protein phosphatase [Acidimicrobiales bacterium]